MTCEELRSYFEDHLRDAEVRSDRGAVTEHISICADCSRFVEEQRSLGRDLRMIRQAVPAVPESLDAAIVARFRQYTADVKAVPAESASRFLSGYAWAWSAVAAAVIAGALFWLFSARRAPTTTTRQTISPAAVLPVDPALPETPVVSASKTARHRHPGTSKFHQSHPARPPVEMPTRVARTLPEGFRSLMYCDALSCGEQMDMIRVQIPPSAMPRQMSGFIRTSGSVTADVLVGPDGIARGIRFEEIEF